MPPACGDTYTRDLEYLKLVTYEDRAAFFEKQVSRKWEIDEAIYAEFLEMLSPLGWHGGTFFVREFAFGDITSKFMREGDRYFCEVAHYPERSIAHPTPTSPCAKGLSPV